MDSAVESASQSGAFSGHWPRNAPCPTATPPNVFETGEAWCPPTTLTENFDAISSAAVLERSRLESADPGTTGTRQGRVHGLRGSAAQSRCVRRLEPPDTQCERDDRAHRQRQDAGAGRPVRGHEGTVRRLFPHRRSGSGLRAFLGRALPGREPRRHRSAPRVADARIRLKGVQFMQYLLMLYSKESDW